MAEARDAFVLDFPPFQVRKDIFNKLPLRALPIQWYMTNPSVIHLI